MAWLLFVGFLVSSLAASSSALALRHQERDDTALNAVKVSADNPQQLATQLHLRDGCLKWPPNTIFQPGDWLFVTLSCCEDSCTEPLCSQRIECDGQTTPVSPTGGPVLNANVTIVGTGASSGTNSNNEESVLTTIAGDETMTLSFQTSLTFQTVLTTDGLTLTVDPASATVSGPGPSSASVANAGITTTTASVKPVTLSSEGPTTEASTVTSGGQSLKIDPISTTMITTVLENGESTTLALRLSIGEATTVTTDGYTLTLSPAQTTAAESTNIPFTTTNSDGLTILSESGQKFTFPTGITKATTSTGSDGVFVTLSTKPTAAPSSTTSNVPGGILFPISTSVPEPKPTDVGTVLPCNLWFFNLCFRWDDFKILGWNLDIPPGIRPPGPPPPISIDPKLSISVGINGKLPPWPAITIGPDRLPTYKLKPDSECKTESAELCATSTSYGVSLSDATTVTTNSKVVSTCATVYGCNVEDTSTETATTSGCTETVTASDGEVSCPTTAPYFISSKSGTKPSVFEAYVKTLPDKGTGHYLSYPSTPWQSYITDLTAEQAKDAEKQSFMYFVKPVTTPPEDIDPNLEPPPSSGSLERRLSKNLESREDSDQHLRMISAKRRILHRGQLENYLYDPILGKGQTIYIIDDGFNTQHTELQATDRTVDTHILPNSLTLPGVSDDKAAPADIKTYTGHGTHVASIAAGLTHGVASKANLVLVKIKNASRNPMIGGTKEWVNRMATDEAMESVWDWINDDVLLRREKGDKGKFIVNMSNGYEWAAREGFAENRKKEIMERVLERSWRNDIITVVAAGNSDNSGSTLDSASPQVVGAPSNPLITVGAVDNRGILMPLTRYQDGDKGGSISVYAVGEWVLGAGLDGNDASMRLPGTSQAAPAVAGLAAYFASLPSLDKEWTPTAVPIKMKRFIIKYAFKRQDNPIPKDLPSDYEGKVSADSIIVAYNRANEGLCSTKNPSKKRAPNDHEDDRAIARRQEGSEIDVVVDGSVVATSWSESYCAAAATSLPSTDTTTSISAPTTTDPNLPTLITGIITPAGSSCASTTAQANCNVQPGPVTACVTTPACASWTPVPTIDTNSGILTCGIRTDANNAEYFFTGGEMTHARDIFCSNMTLNEPPIKFELGENNTKAGTYTAPDNVNNPIFISVRWRADAGSDCPTMDFSKNEDGEAYHLCQDRLNVPIHSCDTNQAGNQFWKQGGQFFRDCVDWEITSLASACYYKKAIEDLCK